VNQRKFLEKEIVDFVCDNEGAVLDKVADVVGEILPVEVPGVSELVGGILAVTAGAVKTQREVAQKGLGQPRGGVATLRGQNRGPRARPGNPGVEAGP